MKAGENLAEYCVVNQRSGLAIASRVRIAGTSASRRQGLMGIETLATGSGLWINPCEAIHTFGMKMPIDVVFLDKKFCVKKLCQDLRPSRISFCLSASSVLEVEAGAIYRSGVQPGDVLSFQSATLAAEQPIA